MASITHSHVKVDEQLSAEAEASACRGHGHISQGCTTDIWAPGSRTASFGSRQELVAAKYKIEEAQAFGTRMLGGMLAGKSTSEFKFGFKHCQGGLLRSVNWAAVLLWASISPCQFPHAWSKHLGFRYDMHEVPASARLCQVRDLVGAGASEEAA
eukprot:scaffold48119_cov20-Tisochrysis_lutea.AAC.1